MYRFTDNEDMPAYGSLRRPAQTPTASKPKIATRKPGGAGQSRASRSQNARTQPRDWRGRFASVGRKIKQMKRRIKKIKNSLSPKYHMQRVQRTRRANGRDELRRQEFNVPKRRPRKRMPRYRVRY